MSSRPRVRPIPLVVPGYLVVIGVGLLVLAYYLLFHPSAPEDRVVAYLSGSSGIVMLLAAIGTVTLGRR
jgi:hypothetical protein